MKKLTLNVDDLVVESFAPNPVEAEARGTVHGLQQATGPMPGCSTYGCGGGGNDTYDEVHCYTHMTRCEQDTCYPICELQE